MPDADFDAFIAAIFGDAEVIHQPPFEPFGPADEHPHFQKQAAADRRFAASPERRALIAGEIIAYVLDLDAEAFLALQELPAALWRWELRWERAGRLLLRDPSGRTRRITVVNIRAVAAAPPALPLAEAPLARVESDQERDERYNRARALRRPIIQELRNRGKLPGLQGYSEINWVDDVCVRCGLRPGERPRGFDRRTLRDFL
jgi:hypothetical protein